MSKLKIKNADGEWSAVSYNYLSDLPTVETPFHVFSSTEYEEYARGYLKADKSFYHTTTSAVRLVTVDVTGVSAIGFEGVTSNTGSNYCYGFCTKSTIDEAIADGGITQPPANETPAIDNSSITVMGKSIDNCHSVPVPSGAKIFILSVSIKDLDNVKIYNKKLSIDGINALIDARINGIEVQTAELLAVAGGEV